jgi:hypothetical protein
MRRCPNSPETGHDCGLSIVLENVNVTVTRNTTGRPEALLRDHGANGVKQINLLFGMETFCLTPQFASLATRGSAITTLFRPALLA